MGYLLPTGRTAHRTRFLMSAHAKFLASLQCLPPIAFNGVHCRFVCFVCFVGFVGHGLPRPACVPRDHAATVANEPPAASAEYTPSFPDPGRIRDLVIRSRLSRRGGKRLRF